MKYAFLAFLLLLPFQARAALEINITQGNVEPLPIAVAPVFNQNPDTQKTAEIIRSVVSADLQRSGLFKLLNPSSFLDPPIPLTQTPSFANWRALKTDALLTIQITQDAPETITAAFRLWDVHAAIPLTGLQFSADPDDARRIGHLIADAVYNRLTGENGYFDTRIVFIDESGPKDKRVKRLSIMDQDGHNLRHLSDGKQLVLTPRFHPNQQQLAFVSFQKGRPRISIYDLDSNQTEIIAEFAQIAFAPRFSYDGNSLILSLERAGNTDIHVLNLATRKTTALTNTAAIDTAPSYSPDGSAVTFESDRGGSQQIYVMNADGTNVRRISFGDGTYGTPVWSPRGDLIAFTKQEKGKFLIGVMRTDGSGERILSSGFHNEGPTWSPNGRVVMFFRETRGEKGGPSIWSVDLTGVNEQQIKTPAFASDPAWSPLLSAQPQNP